MHSWKKTLLDVVRSSFGLCHAPTVFARVVIPGKAHLVHTSRSHTPIFVLPMAHAFCEVLKEKLEREREREMRCYS
jgi:hypothetical protein